MKTLFDRLSAGAGTLVIAGCLAAVADRQASAACTVSPTLGINFDCSGTSENTGIVTNTGPNPAISGDNGNAAFNLAAGSVFTNSGAITVAFDPATLGSNTALAGYYRTRLYGISGSDAGTYSVINTASGSVAVTNPGLGRLWGIAANGDATTFNLDNAGTVSVVRGPVTLGTVQSGSLTARTGALANAALDVAAAVYSEEELESQTIVNSGTIRASGQLAAAIYTRAGEVSLKNSGTIETLTPTTGFAIGAVSDSGETRSIEIDNSGTITGDIVLVNGQAQRWWALSNGLGTGGQGIDNRLAINSQFGQFDSEFDNSGTVTGNLYYSNGTHQLENKSGGTIAGNIDVDQRDTFATGRTCTIGNGCFAAGSVVGTAVIGNPAAEEPSENSSSVITSLSGTTANYTLTTWGTKSFTFENAGTMTGNLSVRTVAAGTVNGFETPASTIRLAPQFAVSGAGSSFEAPISGAGSIAGTLTIWDGTASTIAETTTVAPEIGRLVHTGEWFVVASDLYGDALPSVESETPLVSWEVGKNAAGALVLGAKVADAATIEGMDANGAATLNALLAADGTGSGIAELGGRIQSIDEAEDLVEVAEQLAPSVEGADTELALTTIETISDAISERFPTFEGGQGDASEASGGKSIWLQPFGVWTREDDYKGETGGAVLGFEGFVTDEATLGLAFAYGRSNTKNTETASVEVSTFAAAIYGNYEFSAVNLNGSLGLARQSFDTSRSVTIGTTTDFADASHDGTQLFAHVVADYPIELGGITLSPVASLFAASLWQDGYTETGTGGIALSVDDQQATSVQSGLGFAVEIPLASESFDLSLELEAAWKHEFGDTSQRVFANFAGGPTFSVTGEVSGRESAELGIGLELALEGGFAASASYEMEIESEGISSQQGVVKIGYSF